MKVWVVITSRLCSSRKYFLLRSLDCIGARAESAIFPGNLFRKVEPKETFHYAWSAFYNISIENSFFNDSIRLSKSRKNSICKFEIGLFKFNYMIVIYNFWYYEWKILYTYNLVYELSESHKNSLRNRFVQVRLMIVIYNSWYYE